MSGNGRYGLYLQDLNGVKCDDLIIKGNTNYGIKLEDIRKSGDYNGRNPVIIGFSNIEDNKGGSANDQVYDDMSVDNYQGADFDTNFYSNGDHTIPIDDYQIPNGDSDEDYVDNSQATSAYSLSVGTVGQWWND